LLQFLPRHLRPRREKIFGPAPEHRLDGNAKARVWAAAAAYNSANRRPGQHLGPLTWATLRVLRALLWRFHGADGGGRCFPAYEKIAAAAKCHRDTVCVALRALEDAGLLSWVHRIARIRRRERDLLGQLVSVWQVIRTSNGYRFADPLDREPGRKGYKSENPARPQNRFIKPSTEAVDNSPQGGGARLAAAQVMQEDALQGEPGSGSEIVAG
jgi:helix-turn-helix protein